MVSGGERVVVSGGERVVVISGERLCCGSIGCHWRDEWREGCS